MKEDDEDEWITEDEDRIVTQETRESIADFRACGGKQWKRKLLQLQAKTRRKEQVRREALAKLRSGGKREK